MNFTLPSHFESRLRLYGIDQTACDQLRTLWPITEPALREGIDRFIEMEMHMPSVAKVFQSHAEQIRRIEMEHLSLALSGRLDEQYAKSCQALCEQEQKLGLSPRTRMIAGTMILQAGFDALAKASPFSPRKLAERSKLLVRRSASISPPRIIRMVRLRNRRHGGRTSRPPSPNSKRRSRTRSRRSKRYRSP